MPAALPILAGIVLAIVAMVMGPLLARADMADIKVALVIGNAKYQSADVLKNPANDAVAVKNALMSIGFNVVLKQDECAPGFNARSSHDRCPPIVESENVAGC